jgi:hypothetical protein
LFFGSATLPVRLPPAISAIAVPPLSLLLWLVWFAYPGPSQYLRYSIQRVIIDENEDSSKMKNKQVPAR